jgi:hypothetical protein
MFDRIGPDPIDPSDVSCFASFPQGYTFSGCKEDKSDKDKEVSGDKTKEVGKDDKAGRAPVKDRAVRLRDGRIDAAASVDSVFATVFA